MLATQPSKGWELASHYLSVVQINNVSKKGVYRLYLSLLLSSLVLTNRSHRGKHGG